MKKQIAFSVALLVIMIVFAGSATYAYFTAQFEYAEASSLEVTSGVLPVIVMQSYEDLELEILASDMSESDASNLIPTKTDEMYTTITATMSEYGGSSEIFYEIYYEPENVYVRSSENIMDSNNEYADEFLIKFTSKLGKVTETYDLANLSEKTLVFSSSFEISGINAEVVEQIDIELEFFNQEFSQDDNAGKSFGGELTYEILKVEYKTS